MSFASIFDSPEELLRLYHVTFAAGRPPIPLEKNLLITPWYLGNQESIRGIADRFQCLQSNKGDMFIYCLESYV